MVRRSDFGLDYQQVGVVSLDHQPIDAPTAPNSQSFHLSPEELNHDRYPRQIQNSKNDVVAVCRWCIFLKRLAARRNFSRPSSLGKGSPEARLVETALPYVFDS